MAMGIENAKAILDFSVFLFRHLNFKSFSHSQITLVNTCERMHTNTHNGSTSCLALKIYFITGDKSNLLAVGEIT
jgi:hypothetical protein